MRVSRIELNDAARRVNREIEAASGVTGLFCHRQRNGLADFSGIIFAHRRRVRITIPEESERLDQISRLLARAAVEIEAKCTRLKESECPQ